MIQVGIHLREVNLSHLKDFESSFPSKSKSGVGTLLIPSHKGCVTTMKCSSAGLLLIDNLYSSLI